MAENEKEPPKKSPAKIIVTRLFLVLAMAAIIGMYVHGKAIAVQHAKRLGKPEAEAGVKLPWDWTGDEWRSLVGGEAAAVSSGR